MDIFEIMQWIFSGNTYSDSGLSEVVYLSYLVLLINILSMHIYEYESQIYGYEMGFKKGVDVLLES